MSVQKPQEKLQYLVRIANTDLDGKKQIAFAIRKIKGMNVSLATALCILTGVDKHKKAGALNEQEISKLDAAIRNPLAAGVPTWMINRQKDPETGVDGHLILGDLDFAKQNDIKRLSKIKSYRGFRHQFKLPVRGQRTKSNFRKTKRKAANAAKKVRKKPAA